jgi:hypothetical protein
VITSFANFLADAVSSFHDAAEKSALAVKKANIAVVIWAAVGTVALMLMIGQKGSSLGIEKFLFR